MNDHEIEKEELPEIVETPEEVLEKPVESLRETIQKAAEESKKDPEEKVIKVKSHKRVVSKEVKQSEENPEVVSEKSVAIPQSYGTAVKAQWSKLPPDIQKDLIERDQAFHKKLTEHDEDRNFGKQMKDVVTPYIAQIRAEGAEPAQAVSSLLNMAHVLRVGSPQQKSDLLLRTAQTFGVDLRQALQVQQAQPQMHPALLQALQKVEALEGKLSHAETLKKQQEDAEIQSQIKTFSSDPKNAHFETVRAHMASLLQSGLAKDLQDAYDQAVYANPHTRSTLLEAQKAESDGKRVAEQKARAEAARKAGSSIKGAPGITATKNGQIKGLDLRSTIRSAMSEHLDS